MNKYFLSIALFLNIAATPFVVANTLVPKENEITVTVGQEFEVPLYCQSDRFHYPWRFSSIDLVNQEKKKDQEIGLELISEAYSKELIEPVDKFFQRANCKLVCKFKATKSNSYVISFISGKVIACSYFPQKFQLIVHVSS